MFGAEIDDAISVTSDKRQNFTSFKHLQQKRNESRIDNLTTAGQTYEKTTETFMKREPAQCSAMESELKSLQSKIMDLENKFTFTNINQNDESQLENFSDDVHGEEGGTKVF